MSFQRQRVCFSCCSAMNYFSLPAVKADAAPVGSRKMTASGPGFYILKSSLKQLARALKPLCYVTGTDHRDNLCSNRKCAWWSILPSHCRQSWWWTSSIETGLIFRISPINTYPRSYVWNSVPFFGSQIIMTRVTSWQDTCAKSQLTQFKNKCYFSAQCYDWTPKRGKTIIYFLR